MDLDPDPGRERFAELAAGDEPVVARVGVELPVGVRPLTAYAALTDRTDAEYAFLLESAEKVTSSDPDGAFAPAEPAAGERHARYSFLGYDPAAVVTVQDGTATVESLDDGRMADLIEPGSGDVLDQLRGALPDIERVGFPDSDRQLLSGGLVGFLAYDAVYDVWLEEVGVARPTTETPDAQFVCNAKTVVFDEFDDTVELLFTPVVQPAEDPDAIYDDLRDEASRVADALTDATSPELGGFVREHERAGPREAYERAVRRAKEHVSDGDIYQGVISRTHELEGEVDPRGFYRSLRAVNPSPYMYLLEYGDRSVVGASPETLVSVRDREVVSNPIAGTCPRGSSPVEDRRLAGEMLADEKERAEHTMLVDLARNDVRRVSQPGSVRVEEFMNVLKYSHVQHIESTVTSRLADDCDAFDATRAAFPAGTLSGAPKVRAMEIIHDLEESPRGLYGGGVGYYSWTGDADFAIVIRTATIEHGIESGSSTASDGPGVAGGPSAVGGPRDRVTVRAGAGIVADSDPTAEYEETEKKMGGVLDALERIETEPDDRPAGETSREVPR
jgi:anthranilate synthase component 1